MSGKYLGKKDKYTMKLDLVREYVVRELNYDAILPLHDSLSPIRVKCYFTGEKWFCPNPKTPTKLLKQWVDYDKLHEEGFYEDYKEIFITDAQFRDKANWIEVTRYVCS